MKIAFVEFSESHEECIYSQISFLVKDKNNVSLFIHPKIERQIYSYKDLFDEITIVDFNKLNFLKKLRQEFLFAKRISKFDKVIFNTASSSKSVRNTNFFLLLFNVESIGVLHNIKKIKSSFTQKIISLKIKKYFVLSDFLKEYAVKEGKQIKIESFYPIFFPKHTAVHLHKNSNEKWIAIPGRVELQRREYTFLIEALTDKKLLKNSKFLILGNINTKDGIFFKEKIISLNLAANFMFFDGFIENDLYYNYLEKSDFVLPLLKNNENSYKKEKISGT
ncbi:MAG: hypothetical protein ACWIPI_09465, partial [Polaribacter sp.]